MTKKIIIGAIILVLAGLGIYKVMTDPQMKQVFMSELEEKKDEVTSLVKEGKLPEKDPMERVVTIDGMFNMRDMGLVESAYGEVEKGKLYRSETLYNLTESGIKAFEAMNFDLIIDFRGDDEIDYHPNKGMAGTRYVKFSVTNPANVEELIPEEHVLEIRQAFGNGDIDRFNELLEKYDINIEREKQERYVQFAEHFDMQFSSFLHALLDKQNQKILFHCEGGKDRTGYAAALFYKLLGVKEAVIVEDFLMTNTLTAEKNAPILAKMPESLHPTVIADAAHLEAPFKWIDEEHGSFENYRRDVLGISDEELEILVEKFTD